MADDLSATLDPSKSAQSVPPNPSDAASQPPPAPIVNQPQPTAQFPPVQIPPAAPSFRPLVAPQPPMQFVPAQNPGFQNTNLPGGFTPAPGQMMHQQNPAYLQQKLLQQNPAMRPFAPMLNGYPPPNQGAVPIPGVRYPSPYPGMVRSAYPTYPLRPPGVMGMTPMLTRPPVPGVPGVHPMILPVIRPAVVPVTPIEKPQTTVWVGKIAPTVDNDFMLSLLQLCGPVKSWKRTQNPSDGSLVSFGFCEFESPEGVLRALRLLSKFNIDGQELVLNVNQSTRNYLERYVLRKTENSNNLKDSQGGVAEEKDQKVNGSCGGKPGMSDDDGLKTEADTKNDVKESDGKDSSDTTSFGIVTDEDRLADQEASQKLNDMIDERLKNNPLPPPPAHLPADSTKVKDKETDLDADRNDVDDEKNDDTCDNSTGEHEKPETSSPERSRRQDRNKDRDRERDVKRDKDREFDRLERETQRERERKEKERERKMHEAEREYKERLREWEFREKEKEKHRKHEKEKEKDKERKRKREVREDEGDDDDSRKRVRRGVTEDKRRKRQREKEDDLADRLQEEEELAEAEKRAKHEQAQLKNSDALKMLSGHPIHKSEKRLVEESVRGIEKSDKNGQSSHLDPADDSTTRNDNSGETAFASADVLSNNGPARKLGFGLIGSGKRTAVPSVFKEEEDDDAHNDKKMRPLVPIDYSTEEIQAVHPSNSGQAASNLVAAAEFAKRISGSNSKDEKPDGERERSSRSYDRSIRDRDHSNEESHRTRDDKREKVSSRERHKEPGLEKLTTDNKKLLDAKQLIDMIPKTKEELFSYKINWVVYDEHNLHERMRPWISKKITEFLGEEEATLVDYIVSNTQEHVNASDLLGLLQSILDDEAEMFVLKMWRMLIFEIKKVETGLATKLKS